MNINFEQTPFEKDLQRFSKEVKDHQVKNKIENIQESHIKDVLVSGYSRPVAPSASSQKQASVLDEIKTLPNYLISEPAEVKNRVEGLISLAFSEGIERSAKEAAKSGPFILDAFHDALTSKLYEELKKRGLLK
ncbi:MAG: hypothetical protein M1155_02550 [Patescibacteria group bacterium]|nr:hypothetical protein [Patescibacteria group bacterium]